MLTPQVSPLLALALSSCKPPGGLRSNQVEPHSRHSAASSVGEANAVVYRGGSETSQGKVSSSRLQVSLSVRVLNVSLLERAAKLVRFANTEAVLCCAGGASLVYLQRSTATRAATHLGLPRSEEG